MRRRISKFKAKVSRGLGRSRDRVPPADPKPATAEMSVVEGRGRAQVSTAHVSTAQVNPATSANVRTPATEASSAQSLAAQDPVPQGPAAELPITQGQSVPEPGVLPPRDISVRELWDLAYENLRKENPKLIDKYEGFIRKDKDMSKAFAAMLPKASFKREQMEFVLQRKMDDVKRDAWKLKFGSWREIEVKEIVEPALGVIDWANKFITQAISGNAHASIAWAGVSLLLPLLLNPSKQASSLAKGLDYISNLILQGRMREELFIRRCESGTGPTGLQAISLTVYKDGLEKLYRQILTFQAEAYCYYASDAFQLVRDMVKWDDWESQLAAVKERENAFSKINEVWKDSKYDDECSASQKRHDETRLDLQSIGADLTGLRQAINEAREDKKRSRLLTWLCDFDTSVIFNNNRSRHEQGTCEWLLEDCGEFKEWKKLPASFLWLHGKAGSGKSVLSSSVVNHLRSSYQADPETALAYFYFTFAAVQTTDTMLSSLIKQLCARRPTIAPSVDGFQEYVDRGDRPDISVLEQALLDTTCCFSTAYLIIDGLDEVPTITDERRQLMRSLHRLLGKLPGNVHVLCTSRKEPDILAALSPHILNPNRKALDITQGAYRWSLDRDIRRYIESTLETPEYSSWPQDLKHEAQNALTDKADGMFQYVVLQLQELRKPGVSSPLRIRKKLESLPHGLDETYDRVFQNIDEGVRSEVRSMLIWLAFGDDRNNAFDLTLETLAQVLSFRPDRDGVADDDDQLFQAEEILRFMPGLVLTFVPKHARDEWEKERNSSRRLQQFSDDKKSNMRESDIPPKYVFVRIAHFSVLEYLMSEHIRHCPAKPFAFSETEAHVYIAQTWLAYHLYSCSTIQPQRLTISRRKRHPDVCWQWAYHMEAVRREDWPQQLESNALHLLSLGSKGFSYFKQYFTSKQSYEQIYGPWMLLRPHCCTAFAGWFKLTQLLLSGTSGANRCLTRQEFDAVLYCAADQGHVDIVRLALEMGASVHARHLKRHCFGTELATWVLQPALQAAANNGHLTTMELLLAQGADVNARDSLGQSVLHTLVREQGLRWNFKSKVGADVDASDSLVHTESFFQKLRRREEAPPRWNSTHKIINFLLDRGANVNARDNNGCSVLKAAMSSYDVMESRTGFDSKSWVDTVRLLLHRGADPHSCSSSLGVPFGAGLQATRYLLGRGADVNQTDPDGLTALQKAVTSDKKDTIRLLLDWGADVSVIEDGVVPSVLQAACHSKYVYQYLPDLLDDGAVLAERAGYLERAILNICANGLMPGDDYLASVRIVLEAGADVNANGGQYGYPLQAAVAACYGSDERRRREAIELLLNSGAQVNARGGKYCSALQAACWISDPCLVRLLLDRGADPNIAGGEFGNPLTAAVWESRGFPRSHVSGRDLARCWEIVNMLLDAGAHVNARGNRRYATALHAAAQNASAEVMRLLLERGANVNDPKGGRYGGALQAISAKRWGDSGAPSLLLEHGAGVVARGGHCGEESHAAVLTRDSGKHDGYRPPKTTLAISLLLASGPSLDVNYTNGRRGSTADQGSMVPRWTEEWINEHQVELVMADIRKKLQLLVDYGVDVHLGGGKYGSPVQAACALDPEFSYGRAEMLLELSPNVEVNSPGGLFGFPLQAAAYSGQTETVRVLLKRKAEVNARGGRYRSALNAAILRGHWEIVQILRDAGAITDCEILDIPDQLWLWEMEREEHVHWIDKHTKYQQDGEHVVARYEKFWEVETGKKIPVDWVLEWLFG